MSNSILVSLQNISSSLKSVRDVVKADNFYDTIYCGKYYDRFSVIYDGVMSYMYVIKLKNTQMDRFLTAVDRVSLYSDYPFAKCKVYREELLCYEGKNAGVYYDIVIIENIGNLYLVKFLSNGTNITPCVDLLCVVKSFTSAVLWMLHYNLHIGGFCGRNVVINRGKVQFAINERIEIVGEDETSQESKEEYFKKMLFAVFASWILLLRVDKNYKVTDIMLNYLESYNLEDINETFSEFTDNIDKTLRSNLASIARYVVDNDGELQSVVACLKKMLKVSEEQIENFYLELSNSNSYFNSEDYDLSYGTSENKMIVRNKKTNKYGYVNCYGDQITDFIYDEVILFSEGIAVVCLDKKYFAIDSNGNRLTDEYFDGMQWYSDINRFIVHKNGCYLLLNRACEVVTKRSYSWIGEFSFNRSVVESSSDERKGYIDLDGNEITPISYDDALSFENGIGKVLFEGEWRTVIFDGDVL